MLGLTWSDVDLVGGTLKVERRLLRTGSFGPPKGTAGTQTIGLSDLATYALRAQRKPAGPRPAPCRTPMVE